MHLTAHPGRATAAGLATLAALASMGGAAAVMATRTSAHQGQHAQAVAVAGTARVAGPATEPAGTPRPTMRTNHPLGAAVRPARPAQPLTAAQAVALAAARTKAHVDEVEASTGPFGTTYDVKLVRADGSDVDVLVVARTAQVSVNDGQPQAAQVDERPPADAPVPNEPGHPLEAPDQ